MSNPVELDMLIRIREELTGLNRTRQGIKDTKKDADGLVATLKQGFGIGSGMQIATSAVNLLKSSFTASIGEAFRLAEEIKDQGEALGVTTEAYQVMRFELAQGGVEMGRFAMAVNEQTQSLATARIGAGATAEAYKTLGLSVAELERMSPEQRVLAVARATLTAADQTKAFQAAGVVLGSRGLPQLLSALRNLAENGYDKVAASAKNAGYIMAESTVEMLDAAKQRIDNFKQFALPVATGTAIGWVQGGMDWVGGTLGNAVNFWDGLPQGQIEIGAPKAPKPGKASPLPAASAEAILTARLAIGADRAGALQNNALLTEAERRRGLLPILKEQVALYEKLAIVQFGENWRNARIDLSRRAEAGSINEAELATLKQMEEMETKIRAAKLDRLENIDRPLDALNRGLLDTTGLINEALAGGVTQATGALSSNIWGALKGTNEWKDSWRSLGDIAGQVLSELLVKMMIVQPLLSLFGFGGDAGVIGVGDLVTKGWSFGMPKVKSGGGGTFVTRGPTNFTVGDNPGGVELVQVLPLSGMGQTTINGTAMRMAGGGAALVGGGGGGRDTFFIDARGADAAGIARLESMLRAMNATVEHRALNAVSEAQRRKRMGFR